MDETNWSVLINDVHSTIEPQSLKTKPKYFTFHTFGMQVFYKILCWMTFDIGGRFQFIKN